MEAHWWQARGYLTVDCPRCGTSYSTAICVDGAQDGNFAGLSLPCAQCGTQAEGIDGTYRTVNGLLTRIADAKASREEIGSLVAILQAPESVDPQLARAAIEEAVPRLAPFLNDYFGLPPEQWLKWLAVFMAAIPA